VLIEAIDSMSFVSRSSMSMLDAAVVALAPAAHFGGLLGIN
jgi:hypothetical protein